MGGLRQERVGGGRTNASSVPPIAGFPGGDAGRAPSGAAGSRPSTAGSRRSQALDSSFRSQGSGPHGSRPGSAPASRPSTAGSARPPRPWQQEGEDQPRTESGVRSSRDRGKRDDLFSAQTGGSGHGSENGGSSRASSRPGTANSRASRSSREGLPPKASRPVSAPATRPQEPGRPATGTSTDSESSEACEERLLSFQKFFQDKNFAKFSQLKDAFRDVDKDKNGVLTADEVGLAMASLDIPVDRKIIERLMSRCNDPEQITMQEFKDLLWIDDTMETYIDDRKNRRAGFTGDGGRQKYLWTRIQPVVTSKFIGCLNDTLEADKKESGTLHPRLDYNFSSVSYDILSFGERNYNPPKEYVHVPVKSRPRFFDAPGPHGRRVAYDRGDTPYNLMSLASPRGSSDGGHITSANLSYAAPVRLVTFARVHNGELPTQLGHMLTKTVV